MQILLYVGAGLIIWTVVAFALAIRIGHVLRANDWRSSGGQAVSRRIA